MSTKKFSINDVERLSGIKAHTVRIWERRYSLLQPTRLEGNTRHYTFDELKKILNIALLKKNGYRISALSKLSCKEIEDKTERISNDYIKRQKAVNDLIINMYILEPASFERVLGQHLLHWPSDIFIEDILFPFLNITRLLWTGSKLYEEHLVVTTVRRKLISAIENFSLRNDTDKVVLLFLPDGKQLDLGLLYSNYYLARRGIKVLYMGNDVTIENLLIIFNVLPPSYLFTYLPANNAFNKEQLLQYMRLHAKSSKLIIGKYSPKHPITTDSENCMHMDFSKALEFLHDKLMA